ncbi:MAG: hypothetical protein KGR42_05820 [Acidobacteria bacterium]|nr:hypothetical protein [Acidobacteriota bacterium]
MNRGLRSVGIFLVIVVVITLIRLHSHHPSGPTTTVSPASTSTTITSSTTSTSTSTSTSTVPSTSTTVAVVACTATQLQGTFALGTGSAGTVTGTLSFHNSGATCALKGSTTWSGETASKTPVTLSTTTAGLVQLTVAAGQSAGVSLTWSDIPQGTQVCPSVKVLNVSVGSTGPLSTTLTYPITPCDGAHLTIGAWR